MKKGLTRILFILLFVLCGKALRYLLVDDTESLTRLMLHEFYAQDNIDVLFVGSSHCYAALDPEITDRIFGVNTFNAGTSLQALDASYTLIREAATYNDLREVYLELYFKMADNDEYREREQMTGTYIVSDYLRPGLNRWRFLLEASSPAYYVHGFIPARREWQHLFDMEYLQTLFQKKQKETYRRYLAVPEDDGSGYRGKGFNAGVGSVGDYFLDSAGFDRIHTEKTSRDWQRTLGEIIRFCQKKHIKLTLFSAPMADFQIAGVGNYDEYIAMVRELTAESGVEYFDFNLCRPEYFSAVSENFIDAGHLNLTGAERFSEIFARFFTGQIPATDLFYCSAAEKLQALSPCILGLSFQDEGNEIRNLKIVSTREQMEYAIKTDNGFERDFSTDPFFSAPRDEHAHCTIRWRMNSGQFGSVEMDY